ncbi:general substrate transporter, partial [Lipomyces mesembrius]
MVRFTNVYTITAFVALAGMMYGFDIASISGIIGTDQYQDYYGNPVGVLQGAITSATAAGSFVGSISATVLGDKVSRKVAIQWATILWVIGAIVQSTSNGVAMLISGRLISGLCIGITSSLVPIYLSEIAPRKIRGRLVSFQQLAVNSGVVIQYLVQYGCSFLNSEAVFRLPWAIQTLPAIILFISLFWFPYSPRWLAKEDRWEEVLHVLASLRTAKNNINDPLVLAEYREIEDQIRIDLEEGSSSFRTLYSRRLRKRVFLAIAIEVAIALSGISVLLYYGPYLLKAAGFKDVRVALLIQHIISVLVTVPSILWTDQFGRRPAFLIGSFAMTIFWTLIGGLLVRYGEPNPIPTQPNFRRVMNRAAVSRAILAFVYLAVAFFNLTWGPLRWIYPSEVVPLKVRAKSVSLATAFSWGIEFALSLAVPPMFRAISWRILFIYVSFNFATFIYIWIAAPETMLRTLEEMDEVFEHGEPVWKSLRPKPLT